MHRLHPAEPMNNNLDEGTATLCARRITPTRLQKRNGREITRTPAIGVEISHFHNTHLYSARTGPNITLVPSRSLLPYPRNP